MCRRGEAADAADSNRRSEYFQNYAPGAVIHAHGATTVDALPPFYDAIWAAFPDAQANIEEVVAESDKLAYRLSVRATHTGR
jgi:predicted ester cyclase